MNLDEHIQNTFILRNVWFWKHDQTMNVSCLFFS